MIPASFMSAVASMVITLPFAHILSVSDADWLYLAAFGVTQLGLGLLLLTEGSRRIPAAQVALIGSLDIPFAILLVWLAFSEVPPPLTMIGGGIILIAVLAHMRHDYFAQYKPAKAVQT